MINLIYFLPLYNVEPIIIRIPIFVSILYAAIRLITFNNILKSFSRYTIQLKILYLTKNFHE